MNLKSLLATVAIAASITASAADAPRYVFYFIGDGMGVQPVLAAQAYSRIKGLDTPIMLKFPAVGMLTTHSASSPVTDSAAAGTALSTGSKTRNGMLGMNADTIAVESVAKKYQAKGYGIGIATNVYPDDATPGAFYAHVPNRGMTAQIGKQAAESGYQFIGGSYLRGLKDKDGNDTGVLQAFKDNNVDYVKGTKEARASKSEKVFMVYPDSVAHIANYTIDSIPGFVSLPDITQTCLDHLLKVSPDKFFIMIEGGNIDHAAHGDDGGTVIKDILNFNEGIQIAYDFYLKHPDETLIVVTADHNTGGMSLGNSYLSYDAKPLYIDYQRISKDAFNDEMKAIQRSRRIYRWEDMKEFLTEKLGFWTNVPVSEKQTEMLKEKFEQTFVKNEGDEQKTLYNNFSGFTAAVFKVFNDICGFGWTTTYHTGDYVPVYAIGVDAQKFAGIHDNIEIPKLLEEVLQGK
ncbi:MAG: alkaline phosphatase [Muribaculaceae bacterium]|nr:alkaline phosphatase [Muribaculaceae bacterium]